MISQILLVLAAAAAQCSAQDRKWEFMQPRPLAQPAANPGILDIQGAENAFPAWYHMPPKVQHSPTYGAYERRPEQVDPAYRGYPSFSRQPPTQQQPFEAPRRPFPQPDVSPFWSSLAALRRVFPPRARLRVLAPPPPAASTERSLVPVVPATGVMAAPPPPPPLHPHHPPPPPLPPVQSPASRNVTEIVYSRLITLCPQCSTNVIQRLVRSLESLYTAKEWLWLGGQVIMNNYGW